MGSDDELTERITLRLYNTYRIRANMKPVDSIGANETPALRQCRDDARAALQVVKDAGWMPTVDASYQVITGVVEKGEYKGQQVWLYWSPEGGGWWRWSEAIGWRHKFQLNGDKRFEDAWRVSKGIFNGKTCGPMNKQPSLKSVDVVTISNKNPAHREARGERIE